MSDTVGIVIVSHSQDIAKGTADMVRQMVGSEVRVAFCGGNPDGGLGTNVPLIIDAINKAWSPKGVAVLVDLGGADVLARADDLPVERILIDEPLGLGLAPQPRFARQHS